MDFSWRILVWVTVCNLGYYILGYVAQVMDHKLPPRHSIIPGTDQKFLYMQDLWRTGLADLIGVTLIYTAFFHLVWNGKLNVLHWSAFALLAIISSSIFLWICLGENHKPDVGFPTTGVISMNGLLQTSGKEGVGFKELFFAASNAKRNQIYARS